MEPGQNGKVSEAPVPKCGHCGAGRAGGDFVGAPIGLTFIMLGGARVGVFFCGNPQCGAVHSVQVLEVAVAQREPEKPMMVVPS